MYRCVSVVVVVCHYKKSVQSQPVLTGQTVTVHVYRQDKQCVQHSKDQNSYFGMSVDVVVVGTAFSGMEQE